MAWLIILFVLMLMISPVMWIRPSPRQRRVATLRSIVMKEGVSVKLERPPLHEETGVMPAYRWAYPPLEPGPDFVLVREHQGSVALKPFLHGWRWRIEPLRPLSGKARSCLEALLTRLPQDALILESSPSALTLWWWESQDEVRFSTYLEDFAALRNELSGYPDRPADHPTLEESPPG